MLAALIFLALVCLLISYNFYFKRRGLPPGPTPLPLIGNLLTLRRRPPGEEVFLKWRKEYGPIYTYWLGELPVVCVADYPRMVELFQRDGDTFAGRWTFREFYSQMLGGTIGVVFTEGELWHEHRRFALRVLRDFGLGKNLMQERVLAVMETFLERIRVDDEEAGLGGELDVVRHLDVSVGSIINSLLFGYRFEGEKEQQFYHLKEQVQIIIGNFGNPLFVPAMINPRILSKLPYIRTLWARSKAGNKALCDFFMAQINEHLRELDALPSTAMEGELENQPTDYVHAYLRERARREVSSAFDDDENLGEGGHQQPNNSFSLEQLKGMCYDLWIAGQETSTTTLSWGIAHLIANPRHQARLQEELDRVIGDGGDKRWVTMADRPHLPFTCACVAEMQRMANLLPSNLLHRVTREVEVDGYSIPAGTAVVPQISAVLYDPELYPDPHLFDPTRHLDSDGQHFKPGDELVPFSLGKRQCLGEPLARVELFIFLANLFHRYRLTPSHTRPMPQLGRSQCPISTIVACPHFVCRVEKRMMRK